MKDDLEKKIKEARENASLHLHYEGWQITVVITYVIFSVLYTSVDILYGVYKIFTL